MRALRQINEASSTITILAGDSATLAQASVAAPSTSSKNVRRVETVILDEDEEDNVIGHIRMMKPGISPTTTMMKIESYLRIHLKPRKSSFCGL